MAKVQKASCFERLLRPFYLFIVFIFIGLGNGFAQFWTEDFGTDNNCANQGQIADGYTSNNGDWTVVNDGMNGPFSNVWFVSSTTAGGYDPAINDCGSGCIASPSLGNQTLHIGVPADNGANYTDVSHPLGFYNTSKQIESPVIDCSGNYSVALDLWYVAGANADDKASVMYFDGTSWTNLGDLSSSGTCTGSQFPWDVYQVILPASANDNPDVQIGFKWVNNSDGVKAPFSVAIDNIRLTAGAPPAVPQPDFETLDPNEPFCEGGCVTFNDLTTFDFDFSTGAANATYEWEFPGGDPETSSLQIPTVCYDTPGSKSITLTVTDNLGESDPVTKTDYITVLECGPEIDISASAYVVCANEDCIDFTDLSTTDNPSGITAWLWTFTSPSGVETTSTDQNPTDICPTEVGFYDVTLQATDDDLTKEQTFPDYIEVLDCSGPKINFEADRSIICPGGCIKLTDLSTTTSEITEWNWSLPGGQVVGEALADSSTQQNPTVCYENPGTYTITLSAVDAEGPSAITKSITITVDPCTGPPEVGFTASVDTICVGDCVDFTDESFGLVEDYLWVFQGTANISDATSTLRNPSAICYSEPGAYNVTLTVSNSNNQVDSETKVNYIVVEQCINKPVPRIEVSADTICAGKCIDFTNKSTGVGLSSYQWNFQGAVVGSGSSIQKDPSNICYDTPGTYDVSLFVEGAGGDSLRVFKDVITVISTPECRPTIEVSAPDTICAGDCAVFSAVFTDADSVLWTFQGGNPATSKAFDPGMVCFEDEGHYIIMVEAWNPSGGAQPQVLDIFVGNRPPLDAGPNRTINSGAVISITASLDGQTPNGSFLWQPFDLVDDFTAQTVKTSPDETTQYIVYYNEPGTCTAIDTVVVTVNFVAAVGVPSTFSPNGDGQNDELRVLGQGITRMDFKVFNRYGQLVFQTRNQSDGWDGKHKGKELNPGTFVYTLEVTFAEGETEVYTGNVTLVK